MKVRAALAWLDVSHPRRMADLVELAKPGITVMVLVTAATGFLLGSTGGLDVPLLVATLLGTGLLSSGGSALNHVFERDTDALMRRTADRPLPAGRMEVEPALVYGTLLVATGLLLLSFAVNARTALLGALAVTGYAFVYTPLKRVTSLSTVVGAVPGAMPPLMGWVAARDALDAGGLALFTILFLWQLPHFLAIAWLCRDDYARAGFPLLTVLEPDGRSTGRQMVLYCAALLPASLTPTLLGLAGPLYFFGTLALGLAFLALCALFPLTYSRAAARNVLLASVAYLPGLLVCLVVDRAF